jgi:arylsulfatase A-like enzyme
MKKRSLVLVTVDCLRADHVGFLGYSRPVTPNLDALAEDSVVVSNAIVAGAPTYFSFPGILASRYPLALGRDVLGLAPGEETLPNALQGAGYATAAFLAGNPYLSRRFGYDQGFDTFRDFLDSEIGADPSLDIPAASSRFSKLNRWLQDGSHRNRLTGNAYDELYFWYCQWVSARERIPMDTLRRYPAANVIVDQATSWLSGVGEQPLFLWLHLMDPHHPYYPPEESLAAMGSPQMTAARARFLNSFWNRWDIGTHRFERYRNEILSLYDAGVHWVDRQLARLVESLKYSRRWEETVFVVTADHGESFLEHGERYHSPTSLPQQLIHVPLLMRAPGLAAGRLSQRPFNLIDLAPTLLDAVGVVTPDGFQGRSGWKEISAGTLPDRPAITECIDACNNPMRTDDRMRSRLLAVRDGELKLVINFSEKRDYLYDLKNDPGENSPLLPGVRTRERARLLQVAHQHLRETGERQKQDLRLRALLRDLQQSGRMKGGAPVAPVLAQTRVESISAGGAQN